MPLAAKLITLVLFTAVMWAVGWVLQETIPPTIDWLGARIGAGGVWAILLVLFAIAGVVGYWPRRPDGSMRLPRSP